MRGDISPIGTEFADDNHCNLIEAFDSGLKDPYGMFEGSIRNDNGLVNMKTVPNLTPSPNDIRLPSFFEETHTPLARPPTDKQLTEHLIIEISSEATVDNLVTLNLTVRLRDLESGLVRECMLVNPQWAPVMEGAISVFAPLGVALIGCMVGDVVESWELTRYRRLGVDAIVS